MAQFSRKGHHRENLIKQQDKNREFGTREEGGATIVSRFSNSFECDAF